ncbi:hypothetical protein [Marinigracilibium pacificum]|uniref:Lipoprotein n=1 Tax=Marinigracilibium pacificum TaxID=2729599 RepID=A0A848J029_9BACT|nr:hypothetical protein [Marinigracilibium pacificum]NMM49001.1 hypothetical protein [Marinigracilibium pacificum]
MTFKKILFPYLLLITIIAGCKKFDNTHEEINPKDLNIRIALAAENNEEWTLQPMTIIQHFYDYPNDAAKFAIVEDVLSKRPLRDSVRITVYRELLPEDNTYGIRTEYYMKERTNFWEILTIRKSYKCNQGFGNPFYSGEKCN